MKRPQFARQAIVQRIGARRTQQERVRRINYLARKRAQSYAAPIRGPFDTKLRREVVPVPEVLDLGQNRQATLAIARTCRENCFIYRRSTVLDFTHTKKISSAAVLLLVAEIDRCRRLAGESMLTGTYPKDKKLHGQMRDSGFFEALHVKAKLDGVEKKYPMEYIKVVSGDEADGRLARALRLKLLGPFDVRVAQEAKSSFFRSLSEAMTNVSQHAYPEDTLQRKIRVVPKGWWMLGHINKLRSELKVMIVDQGIGIPRSLPRKHTLEVINDALSQLGVFKPTDGQMIKAALEVGRSRMRQDNRGKGLNDLKKLIQACGSGRLRILSNRGEYIYTEGGKERLQAYDDSIYGTFIEWTVPLQAILPFLEDDRDEND
jgi:anti-anti-sigma regulatory factor